VALSSAAIVAVYAVGYPHTAPAAADVAQVAPPALVATVTATPSGAAAGLLAPLPTPTDDPAIAPTTAAPTALVDPAPAPGADAPADPAGCVRNRTKAGRNGFALVA